MTEEQLSKVVVSAYLDANLAEAAKAAASVLSHSQARWIAEAIRQRLSHEGLLPADVQEQNSIQDEVKATLDIAGPDALLKALGKLRKKASIERATA